MEYDLSKFFRDPERVKRRRENGYRVVVTRRESGKEIVVEDYFVSPEQIARENAQRDSNLRNRRVQG